MDDFFRNIRHEGVYKFFSNGEWLISKSGRLIDVKSPVDGSVVGSVQAVSIDEVDEIIEEAKEGQRRWVEVQLDDRANILKKAAILIEQNVEELASVMAMEIGKSIGKSRKDILRGADIVAYTADQLGVVNRREVLSGEGFPGADGSKRADVMRQPIGVVLAITPFNYPINLACTKIAPGLLMGNSIVVKGATNGSILTAMLIEIFNKAGVSDGAIGYVSGRGSEIGDYLIGHKGINMINFTGSTEVGEIITAKAGVKPLLMELGGKDAALVLPDVDVEKVGCDINKGAFGFSGQRCTAIKRVLAHKDIYDQLVEAIVADAANTYTGAMGDPRDKETIIGPLISSGQADYVQELIEDARENGANILVGGNREENFIEPTVIVGVTREMRIYWEEQFAPIVPIIQCDDEDEMVGMHNESRYGLGGCVYSRDVGKARGIAEKLETGVVQINQISGRFPDSFPFLGVKDSGIGVQGIRWSIEAMSRVKSVVDNL